MNEAALKLRDRAEQMGIGVSVHGLVDDHEVDAQRLELGAVQKGLAKADRRGVPASPAAPVKVLSWAPSVRDSRQ